MKRAFVTLLVLLIAAPALARDNVGRLESLRIPSLGQPAMLRPGDSFSVVARHKGAIVIRSERFDAPLTIDWQPAPRGEFEGQCTLPENAPVGPYEIEFSRDDQTERTLGALYVYKAFPEEYQIAHIANPNLGNTSASRTLLRAAIRTLNESGAAFALITGNLTANGSAEEFAALAELLQSSNVPTLVTPGENERADDVYQSYFATPNYAVHFGQDSFLSFDGRNAHRLDDLQGNAGTLHRLRRSIKASRWAVGFGYRYELTMSIRAQFSLFVDNPLDSILVTHSPNELPGKVPWGTTTYLNTPPLVEQKIRILTIGNGSPTAGELLELTVD